LLSRRDASFAEPTAWLSSSSDCQRCCASRCGRALSASQTQLRIIAGKTIAIVKATRGNIVSHPPRSKVMLCQNALAMAMVNLSAAVHRSRLLPAALEFAARAQDRVPRPRGPGLADALARHPLEYLAGLYIWSVWVATVKIFAERAQGDFSNLKISRNICQVMGIHLQSAPPCPRNHLMFQDREEALDAPNTAPAVSSPLSEDCEGAATLLSPSLQSRPGEAIPAFEVKFLLPDPLAAEVQAWAHRCMQLDAYGDPKRGGAYETTTLYLDTPERDVFHRSAEYRNRKYRLRRYGSEGRIYLERKTRKGDRVQKWRTDVPLEELAVLATKDYPVGWSGAWFHEQLQERGLLPACRMTYERTAFVQRTADGPLRLTLDRQIRGTTASDWQLLPLAAGEPILPGEVICELKFRSGLPQLFKELIQQLQLEAGSVSKYRRMMAATGGMSGL
jgi:hypothetical protein